MIINTIREEVKKYKSVRYSLIGKRWWLEHIWREILNDWIKEAMAFKSGLTKKDVGATLDAFTSTITETLAKKPTFG